jgi:hypothetical protein
LLLLCLQPNPALRCGSATALLAEVSADGSEAACQPNAVRQLFQYDSF